MSRCCCEDAGLLDGDALHRGGRPVVEPLITTVTSCVLEPFRVGILHADGEAEFLLINYRRAGAETARCRIYPERTRQISVSR